MFIKFIKLDDKNLKDYLLLIHKIPDIPINKINLVVNKLINTTKKGEKGIIERFIIESYLKLVVQIANKYRGAGFSFSKLIKYGNKGLIKAVREIGNYNREEDFINYLIWTIEGEIINRIIREKDKKAEREKINEKR